MNRGVNDERFHALDFVQLAHSRRSVVWASVLVISAGASVVSAVLSAAFAQYEPWFNLVTLGWPSIFLALWARSVWRKGALLLEVRGPTIVTDGELFHAGKIVARRQTLDQGFVLHDRRDWIVRLTRRGWRLPVQLAVPSQAVGAQVLAALGLGANQTTATVRVVSRLRALGNGLQSGVGVVFFGIPMLLMVAAGPLGKAAYVLLVVSTAVVTALYLIPSSIRIGVDGLAIRWLTRVRFVPYSSIRSAEHVVRGRWHHDVGLELHLHGGAVVWIPVGPHEAEVAMQASALAVRVQEAMTVAGSGHVATTEQALERAGRPIADWVTALRRVGSGVIADHRNAPVGLELLRALVQDATRSPSERAAAAIAFAEAAPEERAQVRILANTTVSAPLARVLTHVASGGVEDPAVAEALAALEVEDSLRHKAR